MVTGALIPARPTTTKGGCTCLWREEQRKTQDRISQEYHDDDQKSSRTTAEGLDYKCVDDPWQRSVTNYGVSHMPGAYVTDLHGPDVFTTTGKPYRPEQSLVARTTNTAGLQPTPIAPIIENSPPVEDERAGTQSRTADKLRWSSKSGQMADRQIPDLLVRKVKKNLTKSTEHKLRELISYKAELLNTLRALVPKQKTTSTDPLTPDIVSTSRSSIAQTLLCDCCLTQLQTYLFFSPVPRSTYLYEHSVASYLSLLDDAISASYTHSHMESITHHELSSILHAELSVVEWRLSLKLARFHKRTGYLAVFPMEIGDYADLEIKRALNKPADGILTTIWKKMKNIGSSSE